MARTMEPQAVLNTAYTRVMRQGRPGMRPSGGCTYMTPEGLRCAIGLMLTPSQAADWSKAHVGSVFADGVALEPDGSQRTLPPRLRPHAPLLREIQAAHDYSAQEAMRHRHRLPSDTPRDLFFLRLFHVKMCQLAQRHGLENPPPVPRVDLRWREPTRPGQGA